MRRASVPSHELRGGDSESLGKWVPIVVPLAAVALTVLVYFIAWGVL